MQILVMGGAAYIGSHTCLQLLLKGAQVTVLDNPSNSSCVALYRVGYLAGRSLDFLGGDIRDARDLMKLFCAKRFDSVIHFAGLKAVGESVEDPLRYFENNVTGTLMLLKTMREAG